MIDDILNKVSEKLEIPVPMICNTLIQDRNTVEARQLFSHFAYQSGIEVKRIAHKLDSCEYTVRLYLKAVKDKIKLVCYKEFHQKYNIINGHN